MTFTRPERGRSIVSLQLLVGSLFLGALAACRTAETLPAEKICETRTPASFGVLVPTSCHSRQVEEPPRARSSTASQRNGEGGGP
ncbi:hypothetical protein GGR33_002469 [Methylobacterium brachythecii]|uniref:Lipoprotein n=1 Tax=Methylobacterium brachythecii TaxID=1176177 RepID=A0A7W6AGL6_9HYPH|nr:hypothetical protein [Methylobacterium brachythecii]